MKIFWCSTFLLFAACTDSRERKNVKTMLEMEVYYNAVLLVEIRQFAKDGENAKIFKAADRYLEAVPEKNRLAFIRNVALQPGNQTKR